jgi:hypothetical protein
MAESGRDAADRARATYAELARSGIWGKVRPPVVDGQAVQPNGRP